MIVLFTSDDGAPHYYSREHGWVSDHKLATPYDEYEDEVPNVGNVAWIDLPPARPELPDEVEIEVTLEDIAEGVRSNCDHCPVALAAWRAFLDAYEVSSMSYALLVDYAVYEHSLESCSFISRFDAGLGVAPFKTILRRADLPFRETS